MKLLWILFNVLIAHLAYSEEEYQLVFSQVLFRHGARAPTERITDPAYETSFPRGLGEMTDRGYENSYKLGELLKERYVDTGFLDANLKPTEMYWRSVNKNRCLSTASTVGYAMFDDHVRHLQVPVFTEEKKETLLNYNQADCPKEYQLVKEKCPDFDGQYHPWVQYEAFIARCLNYTHPVFLDYPFHTIEAHINEYKNNIPLPKGMEQHIDQIMSIYVNVTQFITGTGRHHDPRMMRVKFGYLVNVLLGNLFTAYKEMDDYGRLKKMPKFIAYSTQDWILMGVLDSLGVLEGTVGLEVYPEYNSMIILELYVKGSVYFVKTLYKKEEITAKNHTLTDVSNLVRGCPRDKPLCDLATFLKCCKDYVSKEGEGCLLKKRKPKREIRRDDETVQFAGPE